MLKGTEEANDNKSAPSTDSKLVTIEVDGGNRIATSKVPHGMGE